jgi:outer membrane murein-binding lipoprotein Lpp
MVETLKARVDQLEQTATEYPTIASEARTTAVRAL